MTFRARNWAAIRTVRYMRYAIPGFVLLLVAFTLWGRGWWTHILTLVGLALIIWPLQSTKPTDHHDVAPGSTSDTAP